METKEEQKGIVRGTYVQPETVSTVIECRCKLLAGSITGNRQVYGGNHDEEEW